MGSMMRFNTELIIKLTLRKIKQKERRTSILKAKDNIKGKLLIDLHDSIEFLSMLNRYHQLFAYKRKGGIERNVTQSEFSSTE